MLFEIGTDDCASLRQRQRPEKLKAGHRDYARMNTTLAQKLARLHGERHLRAAGEERNLRIASLRRDYLVGAHGAPVGLFATEAELGQILARERKNARAASIFERELPAFGGFDAVAWPKQEEIGNGTQGSEMLDRLMRRSVLAKPD